MIKNIFNLTKILLKSSVTIPYIINKKTKEINKKSIFLWLIIIITMAITYMSFEIIKILVGINQSTIFLNVLFLILNVIMIFQVILTGMNVYFFSKDLDILLPLPIKSEELLLSKFNIILINLYFTEFIFAFFPLIIYGKLASGGILYYLYMVIGLFIFPILINLIVSIIIMFAIKLSKFLKNKDIFQILVTIIFIFLVCFLEFKVFSNLFGKVNDNFIIEDEQIINDISNFDEKLKNVNKNFFIIDPIVKLLNNSDNLFSVLYLIKIIFILIILLFLFILIGKKYYLKNILNNKKYLNIKKIDEKYIEKKSKKINVKRSYIKKEYKMLFRNPIFFIQCIFPIVLLLFAIVFIVIIAFPNLQMILQSNIFENKVEFYVDLSVICLILGIIQIIFTMSNISISAISREGRDIIYMKFLPIEFYKQFVYKTKLQIFVNNILIVIILLLIKIIFPKFNFIYLFILFVLANLLNILNSDLMLIVDFYKPNLHWNTYYDAIKNNSNKLFQYVLTIIVILLLVYFYKIFNEINLYLACFFVILIISIFILIIHVIIKINIDKLFKRLK